MILNSIFSDLSLDSSVSINYNLKWVAWQMRLLIMFIVTWGKLGWIYHFIDYFCALLTLGSGLNVFQQNTGHSLISKWLVNYSQRTSQAVTPKLIWSAVICLSSHSSHAHFKDSFCVLNQCSKCLAWHCQWPQVSFNTAFHSSRNGPQHETTW